MDPGRAVRCSLSLRDCLAAFLAELRSGESDTRLDRKGRKRPPNRRALRVPALDLRIAIHAGEVVSRAAGTRGGAAIGGDALATAQSLLALAEPGDTLTSRPVQRSLAAWFRFAPQAPLHLRGREGFVHPFRLLGAQRAPAHFLTPFVGRELVFAGLIEQFQQAASRCTPRFLLIEGPPGMGKSRLAWELHQHLLDLTQPVTVLQGRGEPAGAIPFGPIADMLRTRLGLDPNLTSVQLMDRLKTLAARVFPGDPLAPHYLAQVLGCRPQASPLAFMDIRDARAGACYILKRLLEGLAGGQIPAGRTLLQEAADYVSRVESGGRARPATSLPVDGALPDVAMPAAATDSTPSRPAGSPELLHVRTPLVLVIDEFHHADGDTLEFLTYLTQTPFHGPVLLLALGRPEGPVLDLLEGRRTGSERWQTLRLDPLHPTAAARLITALRPDRVPAASLIERLLQAAAGNPLHLEELVKWTGEYRSAPSERTRRSNDLPPIPDGIDAVLSARIAGLPPSARETLNAAAVMGRRFLFGALAEALARDPGEDLDALERRGLIFEQSERYPPAGGVAFVFKTDMLSRIVDERLPPPRCRELHSRLARFFAGFDPAVMDRHPRLRLLAAHHGVAADEPWMAFALFVAAADRARAARSDLEALDGYARALALFQAGTPIPPDRADAHRAVLEKHALVLADLRQFDEAEAELTQALSASNTTADRARLSAHIGALYGAQGKLPAAVRHYRTALQQAGRSITPLSVRLRLDLAESLADGRDNFDEAARLARAGLQHARRRRWSDLTTRSHGILGTLAWLAGRPNEAIRHLGRVQKHHERVDDPVAQCRALHLLGRVHHAQGNLAKAIETWRRQLDLGERFGYEREVELATLALGDVERLRGRYDVARAHVERAAGIALELGEPRGVAQASLLLARIHRDLGEPDAGRPMLESALSLFETVQDAGGLAECRGEFSRVHLLRGDLIAAESHAREYLRDAERARDSRREAAAAMICGTILRARDDRPGGLRLLERALEISERVQELPCWVQCTTAYARARFEDGDPGTALELAKSASFAALNMELAPDLCLIQALLSEVYLDFGLLAEAVHSGRKALHQMDGCDGSPARVPALRAFGRALLASGRRQEALFRLRESERLADRLEMRIEATHTRAVLTEAQAVLPPSVTPPPAPA